jgi:transposase
VGRAGPRRRTLQAFFDHLTDELKASIEAVSIDMSAGYEKAISSQDGFPHVQVVFDPFHVVQLGSRATDQRVRLPLRRRTDRDDLPLLRRHRDRPPSPMIHPQIERRAGFASTPCGGFAFIC